ncbi:MAG: PAS domain-containing sensor histidine kinase, partial [Rhodospirillales bacterium]
LALVGGWIIRPLFRIRNALTAASQDPANAMNYRLGTTGNDEVGETYTAIDTLLFEVSRTYKEQLATLGAIARETSDGIVSYGPDGVLTFANAACLRLCNASSLSQLASEGKPLFRLPGAGAVHIGQIGIRDELSGQAMLSGLNGTTTPCLVSSRVLTDDAGTVLQKFAIFRDITEIRQASKQLEYKNMQLEAADRNKSEFLANVSHELRTPLNAIIGFSNIMRDEIFGKIDNPQYREYVQDIHHSGEHLLQVINALLDLRKVEAGELELTPEAVDLEELLRDTRRMIAPVIEQHGHSVLLDLPGKPVTVLIDRQKMRQVLLNLLGNAAKFSPTPGEIRVTVAEIPPEGLTIAITDHGIGMTEEQIRIAMTSFGQVDSGLDRRFDGVGLGLPLSLALTELHGGRLTLSSIPDRQTTATIHLPPDCILTEPQAASARSVPTE